MNKRTVPHLCIVIIFKVQKKTNWQKSQLVFFFIHYFIVRLLTFLQFLWIANKTNRKYNTFIQQIAEKLWRCNT